jgi:hypothetical protein
MSVSNVALYACDDEDGSAVWTDVSCDGEVGHGLTQQAKRCADLVARHLDGLAGLLIVLLEGKAVETLE